MPSNSVPISSLIPYARNARTHSDAQIAALAGSIDAFGLAGAIVLRDGVIAKGHGTLSACRLLQGAGKRIYPVPGREGGAEPFPEGELPVQDATGWSESAFRAFVIADNAHALAAGWDDDLLKLELDSLRLGDFDINLLGFDDKQLSSLLSGLNEEEPQTPEDGHYTRKIEAPIYKPSGDKPDVIALYSEAKSEALKAEIAAADLPDDIRHFLEIAADRHTVFNFGKIANYYAHSEPIIQRLMEQSALIIIDFDKAIEYGFVSLSEEIMSQYAKDYPGKQ